MELIVFSTLNPERFAEFKLWRYVLFVSMLQLFVLLISALVFWSVVSCLFFSASNSGNRLAAYSGVSPTIAPANSFLKDSGLIDLARLCLACRWLTAVAAIFCASCSVG